MFKRNCPQCGKELSYTTKHYLKRALRNNRPCRSCCMTGNTYARGNKGRTLSEEHRRKLSEAQTGRKYSEEAKRKMSEAKTGKTLSKEARRNMSLGKGGDGVLDKVWDNVKLRRWSDAVKERDDYICQHCYLEGIPGTREIEAHHIVPKSLFPQYAYDLDNGQSLCKECHIIEHHKRPNDPWRAS